MMNKFYKAEGKKNYTSIAYESIKKAIINGELKPGDHLNAPYLAKVLGMSRTPIREALKMLEIDGLVESKNIGVYVKQMTLKEAYDLTDVRAALECQALKSSLNYITDEEISNLENALLDLKEKLARGEVVEYDAVNHLDEDFHKLITLKSNNSFLIGISQSISHITSRYFKLFSKNATYTNIKEAIDELLLMIASLKARDYNTAAEQLSYHIKAGAEEMAELLQKRGDSIL